MDQLPLFQPQTWTVTVSELTGYIRASLEADELLQDLWVQGEVSNLSKPSSGHVYFTLRDADASLRCVMWRPVAMRQRFLPKDGDAIEVHGYISVYAAGGQYQLYADGIRPLGEGRLYQEFLRLKARLESEGLFDPERKRAIPGWPARIGIVTSPTGAALQDILNTLRRRFPLVEVILAPTPVQGEEAPPGIVAALQALDQHVRPDLILLARGGGSIEDLWAFNDERVARAIVASSAPVITGVGHETDFTIADFASDLRAPTPTAAAELAVPDQIDLRAALTDAAQRMERTVGALFQGYRQGLEATSRQLGWHSPLARIHSDRQRLDDILRRSGLALLHSLELEKARLQGFDRRLEAINPQAVLQRGFAVVRHPDGRVIRRTGQVRRGDSLSVHVSDGEFEVEVTGTEPPGNPPAA